MTILFRPVGFKELLLIADSGFRSFPPRLPEQPFFYPVLSVEYARKIAQGWNTKDEFSEYIGCVVQFEVDEAAIQRYPAQIAGGSLHQELQIPAEELVEFNASIIGTIKVIEVYIGEKAMLVEFDESMSEALKGACEATAQWEDQYHASYDIDKLDNEFKRRLYKAPPKERDGT